MHDSRPRQKSPNPQNPNMRMDIDRDPTAVPKAENERLNYPSLVINTEDILQAVKDARKLTSGGLQQITPWHLKRAMLSSANDNCARTAAHLATRWAKGDFCLTLGELTAESKLIALYKDEKRKDIRPISIGCALRRLLTKAYCSKIRTQISQKVSENQLGVHKGGYEIGIHSMRAMAAEAKTNGDAILLLDFANAFNTVSRNLLISLTARMCPELANLAWWLYKLEPRLLTATGEAVRSSSGTQQGCRLSNPLFALATEYISEKLEGIPGLRRTLFYRDDTALVGSPAPSPLPRVLSLIAHTKRASSLDGKSAISMAPQPQSTNAVHSKTRPSPRLSPSTPI